MNMRFVELSKMLSVPLVTSLLLLAAFMGTRSGSNSSFSAVDENSFTLIHYLFHPLMQQSKIMFLVQRLSKWMSVIVKKEDEVMMLRMAICIDGEIMEKELSADVLMIDDVVVKLNTI